MNIFRNTKISTRLKVAFSATYVFLFLVIVISVFSMRAIARNSQVSVDTITEPLVLIGQFSNGIDKLHFAENDPAIFNEIYTGLKENLLAVKDIFEANKLQGSVEYECLIELIATFEELDGSNVGGEGYVLPLEKRAKSIDLVDKLLVSLNNDSHLFFKENKAQVNMATIAFVLIAFVGLQLTMLIYGSLLKGISEPLDEIINAAGEIARGNLSVKIKYQSKSNIGRLACNLTGVSNIICDLILDIRHLVRLQNEGKMSARINGDKYSGAYLSIVQGINQMVGSYVDMTNEVISCAQQFEAGNFSISLPEYLGEKQRANLAFNSLSGNLKNISDDISALVIAAAKGNLSARADENKYKGDWALIISRLNNLLNEIIAPINESALVLSEVSKGNLGVSVSGSFEGDFAIIKDSLNGTIAFLKSYINEISQVLNKIAENDLSITISREYVGDFREVKQSINMIIHKLNAVMLDIRAMSVQIATGSEQMMTSSQSLAEASNKQATSVIMLTELIERINQKLNATSKNTESAAGFAGLAHSNALQADEKMVEMVESIGEIRKSSEEIKSVIKTIEDIAFQTNILSLNASIEAARAAEKGKGFAIVAEEVRVLANKSKNAVESTRALIEGSSVKVEKGVFIANETAELLRSIVSDVNSIKAAASDISSFAMEQVEDIVNINENVSDISRSTTENSSISQETASCAAEFTAQADSLKEMASMFILKE